VQEFRLRHLHVGGDGGYHVLAATQQPIRRDTFVARRWGPESGAVGRFRPKQRCSLEGARPPLVGGGRARESSGHMSAFLREEWE